MVERCSLCLSLCFGLGDDYNGVWTRQAWDMTLWLCGICYFCLFFKLGQD